MKQQERLTILQIGGAILLTLGVIGLIGIALYEMRDPTTTTENTVAAVSFFLIMIGIALLFPDMLKGSDKETTSAMRVAIFMVVSVFVFLAVRTFWGCAIKDFNLNGNWAFLVGAALGSKAIQSFGENRAPGSNVGAGNQPNPLFNNAAVSRDLPLQDATKLIPPPQTPPRHLTPKKTSK